VSIDPNTPVLVGVGLVQQKEEDPLRAKEPIALMIEAAQATGVDAGASDLLRELDNIYVPVGRWRYRNPGKLIGDGVGAKNVKSISALPGVSQQTIISDACTSIAKGEISKAMVVGGEAGYRLLRAQIAGVELQDVVSTELADVVLKPHDEMQPTYEKDSGLGQMPVGYYAIIDNAFRHAHGMSIDERRDQMAALYSGFSEIAAINSQGWNDAPYTADFIREHSAKNSMLAFPYTKLHNSSWNIDQASALLFCSAGEAERLGVPRDKWVFPQVFTEANHMINLTARDALHRCPGAELAGRAAFKAADMKPEELDFLELYTCFPIAQDVYAAESGIPRELDWSFTGAMPFAGGPFNSFVLHATGQLAEHIRGKAGSRGMVTTVSGVLTKQGFAIWGAEPSPNGYQFIDVTPEVEKTAKRREVVPGYEGDAKVAGYTVMYERKEPKRGIVIVDLPDNKRSIAFTEDNEAIAAMEAEEICGQHVELRDGRFRFAQGGPKA